MLNQIKLQIFFILFFFTRDIKYLYKYISLSNNKKYIEILKKKLIEIKKSPSDYINNIYPKFNSIERYAIFGILKKIERKNISIQRMNGKELFFLAHNLEHLAFNLALSLIFSNQGFMCNIYFFYDGNNLFENSDHSLSKLDEQLLEIEISKINLHFERINIFNLQNFPSSKIDNKIKEKIKILSVKDICAYSQIIELKENTNYKQVEKIIIDKSNLKKRFISNLIFIRKIKSIFSKNQYWILHNSNLSKPGALQILINLNKNKFTSHEFTKNKEIISNSDNSNCYKITYLKNREILSFDFSNQIKKFMNSDYKKVYEKKGEKLINNNFNKNFSSHEEIYLKEKFKDEFRNKTKLFILLGNCFYESRYLLPNTHTIFESYKDFLIKTVNFFNNSNFKLIIKTHPNEIALKNKFNETHYSILKKCNMKNIKLIDEDISSYSFLNLSNNFIVYDTDMAVEMIAKDKNVITCGNSKYKSLDISFLPKNEKEYYKIISDLGSGEEFNNKKNISIKRNSSLFWYFFINKMFKDMYFDYGNSLNDLYKNFDKIFDEKNKKKYLNNILNMVY